MTDNITLIKNQETSIPELCYQSEKCKIWERVVLDILNEQNYFIAV